MDNLAQSEREKYRRIWRQPEYRRWSPGLDSVDEAIMLFGAGSVIDFGCGEGAAVEAFRRAGFEVVGVDHVRLHPETIAACLWDIPPSLANADFGFCADVMEHIPPQRVAAVMSAIADKVRRTAYFRISTIPDSMGQLIGETLHLTVRPAEWWAEQAALAFGTVDTLRTTNDHVVLLCR